MKTVRIGLLWHAFGRPNLGVDALSRSNIAIIRAAAARAGFQPHFVLLGKPGSDMPAEPDIEQGPYLRIRHVVTGQAGAYLDAIRSCDIVFDICAGDGFTDIYGTFFFLLHSVTKFATLKSGTPLVLAPQTIGPFNSAWSRKVASHIIDHSRIAFARDALSTQALADLKAACPTQEVIDVAFYLPFTRPPREGEALRIGINVSGLLYRHQERFQLTVDYKSLTHRFIEQMLARPNTEVWLVPHVIHDDVSDEDDYPVTEEIAAQYPGVRVAPKFRNAIEAKSFIAGLDFFTGGRMHACIGAFSAGIAVAPIAYSRKFNGLFRTLGYDGVVDGRALDTETALTQLTTAVDNRAELLAAIRAGLDVANQRLGIYQSHVEALLTEVAKA